MPVWAAKALPYLIAIALAVGAYLFAYERGASVTATSYKLKIAVLEKTLADQAVEYERQQRATETSATDKLAELSAAHLTEQTNAKNTIDRLRADVRAASVRLSIPVSSCASLEAGTGSAAASGSSTEARAELMPETADSLIGIAADGDAAVRQLNKVIDAYESLRVEFNKKPP